MGVKDIYHRFPKYRKQNQYHYLSEMAQYANILFAPMTQLYSSL